MAWLTDAHHTRNSNIYCMGYGKIDSFKRWMKENIDIIVITETKLDDSFTQPQFAIDGYHLPYRRDRLTIWLIS